MNKTNFIEINDIHIPQLDMYVNHKEVQLLRYYEPSEGVFIAESPNVILRALDAGYESISILMENRTAILNDAIAAEKTEDTGMSERTAVIEILNRVGDIPVYTAPLDVLTQITGYKLARGMLCAMRRKKLTDFQKLSENAKRIVILEDVVNPTNVGAIFRSAAALGMDGILLTPGCADPLYRRACRVSMGTVFQIPWTFFRKDEWPGVGISHLKKQGYKTVAMALKSDSVNVDDPGLMAEEKLAVILGTEGDGLAQSTIEDCDYTVCIPMMHGVDSLNVAAASAVAFWELGRR